MVKPKLVIDSAVLTHAMRVRSAAMTVRSTARSVLICADVLGGTAVADAGGSEEGLSFMSVWPVRSELESGTREQAAECHLAENALVALEAQVAIAELERQRRGVLVAPAGDRLPTRSGISPAGVEIAQERPLGIQRHD